MKELRILHGRGDLSVDSRYPRSFARGESGGVTDAFYRNNLYAIVAGNLIW